MTTAANTDAATKTAPTANPLDLIDIDHLRFYVGNAKQAAEFYAHTFGFQIEQIADLTTGSRDEASYLLTQGNIRFLLTTGLHKDHPAQDEVCRFGDGVCSGPRGAVKRTASTPEGLERGRDGCAAPLGRLAARRRPAVRAADGGWPFGPPGDAYG